MIQEFTSSVFNAGWPFWVLSLTPSATAQEVSRAARNIDAQLSLKVEKARFFQTPLGQRERDQFMVREAKAILEDPKQRLLAEFWYVAADKSTNADSSLNADNTDADERDADTENLDWRVELKLPC